MEQNNAPSTAGKGLGVAGMILGILGIILCWLPFVGGIIALIALILSVVGLMQAKKGGNPNKGMIITGLVLSIITLIINAYFTYASIVVASAFMDGVKQIGDSMKNINWDSLKIDTSVH